MLIQIGTILFLPFSYNTTTEILSWMAFLASAIALIILSKRQHLLKKFLLWWLAGMLPILFIFSIVGSVFYPTNDLTIALSWLAGPFAAILWFIYFPLVGTVYLIVKYRVA